MRISLIVFWTGLFLGTVGQIIWAIVFWGSPLFIHHWIIGLVGVLVGIPGAIGFAHKLMK